MDWEKGIPHEKSTKWKRRKIHPQVVEWMWLMCKEMGGYLKIYDIGQQEAWLCWLLLKEFGHHLEHSFSRRMGLEERWQDVCIMGKKRAGIHGADMAYLSVMLPSSHELHDVSMRRQQALGLLELSWREHKHIFSHKEKWS